MSENVDILIIGAGASGLAAAIAAASSSKDSPAGGNAAAGGCGTKVVVLEKMPRPGRKIMITGKGRCNFTNVKDWNDFSPHIYPKANSLRPAFFTLPPQKVVEMFEQAGVECVVERGDRAFPSSYKAADIVDALAAMARQAGAEILCNKEVSSIDTETFGVSCTDGTSYTAKKLLICTGGLSYPTTGSTGDGLAWASELGLEVTRTFPSLTALVPKGYKVSEVSREISRGHIDREISQGHIDREISRGHINRETPLSETGKLLCGVQLKNVSITVLVDGSPVCEEFGDMDFTDGGIEGPIGFRVSRRCVKAILGGSKVSLSLDMKPAVKKEALEARIGSLWNDISSDRRSSGRKYDDRFRILLGKVLPSELVQGFLRCNPGTDHRTLAGRLKDWKFVIEGYVGYERCVVTAGGVAMSQINSKTMEVKKIPGLYFAGEVLDLDGDTGGYNLHTAFCTGYLAGLNAAADC